MVVKVFETKNGEKSELSTAALKTYNTDGNLEEGEKKCGKKYLRYFPEEIDLLSTIKSILVTVDFIPSNMVISTCFLFESVMLSWTKITYNSF